MKLHTSLYVVIRVEKKKENDIVIQATTKNYNIHYIWKTLTY